MVASLKRREKMTQGRFFQIKTFKNSKGSKGLFLNGRQIGSVYSDTTPKMFDVFLLKGDQWGTFPTFQEAEYFAWVKGL
jgi:hypothetical protein